MATRTASGPTDARSTRARPLRLLGEGRDRSPGPAGHRFDPVGRRRLERRLAQHEGSDVVPPLWHCSDACPGHRAEHLRGRALERQLHDRALGRLGRRVDIGGALRPIDPDQVAIAERRLGQRAHDPFRISQLDLPSPARSGRPEERPVPSPSHSGMLGSTLSQASSCSSRSVVVFPVLESTARSAAFFCSRSST